MKLVISTKIFNITLNTSDLFSEIIKKPTKSASLNKLRDLEEELSNYLTNDERSYRETLTDLDSIISDLEDEVL